MIEKTYPVGGMGCAACAARVEKILADSSGVREAAVNYAAATARIVMNDDCDIETLAQAVSDGGYRLFVDDDRKRAAAEAKVKAYRTLKYNTIGACILAVPVMACSMLWMHSVISHWIQLILTTIVLFCFGRKFFVNARRQLRHATTSMDTLVALSTGIAYLFSLTNMFLPDFWLEHGIRPHLYFEASAVIIAFILLGRTMEAKAKRTTSAAIERLSGLQPDYVTVVAPDGTETERYINLVEPGDTVRILPGDRIPVDGTITRGNTAVDESMLTGEPVPVGKAVGDKVYCGTINGQGTILVEATAQAGETLLARIIRMVEDAQGTKPPVQRLVDKIAAVFVPTIIILSILTFFIWVLADPGSGLTHGILAAVTVLIIACPCALGLATPTALMVGIGRGADLGILIRNADSIEMARRVNTIVFDKTGTLTVGHPVLSDIVYADNTDRQMIGNIFSAIERASGHPLAEAVADALGDRLPVDDIEDVETIAGMGVTGRYEGTQYFVGSLRYIDSSTSGISDVMKAECDRMMAAGMTVVLMADSQRVLALAGISDRIKEGSREAVATLQAQGLRVVMLTGDNEKSARKIAREVGITDIRADVLPEDKAEYIRHLQSDGQIVAMTGDGINDSAALAVADLGIAMGTGSDIAMEVAGITIVNADLRNVPKALRLSRKTMFTIRTNLFWAFIYNIIGIPVAAGILYPAYGFLLNPMIAGAAMAFSSVSVVLNSLLLRHR